MNRKNVIAKLLAILKIIVVFAGYYLVLGLIVNPIVLLLRPLMPELILGLVFSLVTMILTFGYHFLILKLFSLKKPLPKSGLGLKDGWLKQFSQGAISAGLIILFLWGLIVVCGGMTVTVNTMNGGTVLAIAVMVIRMLCTGFQEEIITRGTIAFSGKSGGKLFSAIIISVIFGLLHGLGTIQGFETIAVNVTLILFSLIVFVLTWITGDLWAAIGVHFAWNTVMGLLGSPISGVDFTGIIKSSATGNPIINGGVYGIEGSIFTPVVGILILIVLIVRYRKGDA